MSQNQAKLRPLRFSESDMQDLLYILVYFYNVTSKKIDFAKRMKLLIVMF